MADMDIFRMDICKEHISEPMFAGGPARYAAWMPLARSTRSMIAFSDCGALQLLGRWRLRAGFGRTEQSKAFRNTGSTEAARLIKGFVSLFKSVEIRFRLSTSTDASLTALEIHYASPGSWGRSVPCNARVHFV